MIQPDVAKAAAALKEAAKTDTNLTQFINEVGAIVLAMTLDFITVGKLDSASGLTFNDNRLNDLSDFIKNARARIGDAPPPTS